MLRRLAVLCTTALLVIGVAGCGSSSGSDQSGSGSSGNGSSGIDGLTVSGSLGSEPKIKVDKLAESSPKTDVAIEGNGSKLTGSSVAKVQILMAKGTDGSTLQSTYSNAQPQSVDLGTAPQWITDILTGLRVGSRVVYVTPLSKLNNGKGDAQRNLKATDDIVIVIDVLDTAAPALTGPKGTSVTPPKDAPKVVEKDGKVTALDFSGAPAKPPTKLQVVPLVKGSGQAVKNGDQIKANYLGTTWGSTKPFDNTFTGGGPTTFTIQFPGLIKGWVKGLVDVKVGSRVILVVPPGLGYGKQGNPQINVGPKDTLVFVVDVLGVG